MAYTEEFIQKQKGILEQKRAQAAAEINRLKKEDPFAEEFLEGVRNVDTDDDVLELTGHEETTEKINALDKSIKQIDSALKRIQEGTYGYDERTGELIDRSRLEAYPEATTAI